MKKQNPCLIAAIALAAVLCAGLADPAFSLTGPARAPAVITIEGADCQVLKDFFARFEQGKANKVPGEEVKRVLLQALTEEHRAGWIEAMNRTGGGVDGETDITVRVLYVEGRKDEKPIRALITFTVMARTGESSVVSYDERVAALVIRRETARLSVMEQEKDLEEGQFVHILQEKDVRIGGKGVIGLNFTMVHENPAQAAGVLKEERINFYVFQENAIKFAGSVLKSREERLSEGEKVIKSVYTGAIVFKKDMLGNIVGILSPYTITREDRRSEKGMARFAWDTEKEAFLKE